MKFEEEEKEKKLADQKIEISKLRKKKDTDSLVNFNAKDVAKKQELINISEQLDMELKETFDKKEQMFEKSPHLHLPNIAEAVNPGYEGIRNFL